MPNIIDLNLLENKTIVATMQGHPLANENSYKIIAGEENSTEFFIKSIPNQYAKARLTVEMVNAKGYGIQEAEVISQTFSLPLGMAVAGYGYVLFRAYIDNEIAVFQPLKIKVWNTIPQWQDYVSKSTNVRLEDGYLILTENGTDYNLGYVKGDKGESFEEFTETVNDLKEENELLKEKIANNTAKLENLTNTLFENEQISVVEVSQAFVSRQTADGENIIDAQNVFPKLIKGSTVKSKNLLPYPYQDTNKAVNGVTYTVNDDRSVTAQGTATGGAEFRLFQGSLPIGQYTLTSGAVEIGENTDSYAKLILKVGKNGAWYAEGATVRITVENETDNFTIYYYCQKGNTWNINFRPMLNEGATALPYQPYFPDLKCAYFDSIKSIGRNLFNINKIQDIAYGSISISGQDLLWTYSGAGTADVFSFACWIDVPKNTDLSFALNSTSLKSIYIYKDKLYGNIVGRINPFGTINSGDNTRLLVGFYSGGSLRTGNSETISNIQINIGSTPLPFEPYVEETYKVFDNLHLDEYDSFNPQTGELTRQTGWMSKSTPFTEEDLVGYNSPIVSASGKSVVYKLATSMVTKIEGVPKFYKVYNQGQEIVVQGEEEDNSEYGAMCTITNDYLVKIGGENE